MHFRWLLGGGVVLLILAACGRSPIVLRCPQTMRVGQTSKLAVNWTDPDSSNGGPSAGWSQVGSEKGVLSTGHPFDTDQAGLNEEFFTARMPGDAMIHVEAQWTTGAGFWGTGDHEWRGDCKIQVVAR